MKTVIALACALMMSSNAMAVVKCVPDGRGGMCCWDTNRDGPFRTLGC